MSPRRIIDMHHHVGRSDTDEYASALVKVAKTLNIQKFVLQGISYHIGAGKLDIQLFSSRKEHPGFGLPTGA